MPCQHTKAYTAVTRTYTHDQSHTETQSSSPHSNFHNLQKQPPLPTTVNALTCKWGIFPHRNSVYASRCVGMHVWSTWVQLCSVCFKMCWMGCLSVCMYIFWWGLPQFGLISCIFIYYPYNIKTLQLRGVTASLGHGIIYIPQCYRKKLFANTLWG